MNDPTTHIPLVDLSAQYRSIKSEVDAVVFDVLERSAFIGGTFVQEFESAFASMLGVKYCIGVGNGTDALFLVLKALEVGAGDEVIVPANTFIATSEAVTASGAQVVFADVDPKDFSIYPEEVRKKISLKTKAIIAVHLYGHPAQMDELLELAKEKNLFLIEDTAQAHRATYKGRMTGTMGIAGTFSFYPGKNLGAYGDAGAIVTNDEALGTRCRMLANHGRAKGEKYNHAIEGFNSRLDGLQAAILSVKLRHLPEWTKKRQAVAVKYAEALRSVSQLVLPGTWSDRESAYHLYVIRTKERDTLRAHLQGHGIEAGIHYPIGLPYLEAYASLNQHSPSDFPVTYQLQSEILSLPMYPELTDEQIEYITQRIKEFYVSR